MGRKRSRARVSPDTDSDGGEEEGAAATGSKSLYEVRRLQTPSVSRPSTRGGRLRVG
jgi:hypothetical protein